LLGVLLLFFGLFLPISRIMVITAFDLDAAKGLSSSSPFDPQILSLLQIGYKLFQANQFLPIVPLATSIYNHGKPVKIVSIIMHHHCILYLG